MPFLGQQPAEVALTTGDLGDNIVDGTKTKDALIGDYSDVTITASDLIIYGDDTDSNNRGEGIVASISTIATTRGDVADGGNASIDVIGSVSDNQIGLTAGQQYFVQTDGTISTTADDPSVLAGTAISATELVVKT